MSFKEKAKQAKDELKIEYKDPYEDPYLLYTEDGEPRTTDTQAKAWNQLTENDVWRIAMIAAKGSGKAEPVDEPVLTPTGWTTMGELSVGDHVVGRDGQPTKVVGVYPQGVRPIYRLHFNDGTSVRADADHLWSVQTGSMKHRDRGFKTKTTTELKGDLHTSQGYSKWYLPTNDPVHFAGTEELPVPPYSLGALIGDGCLMADTPSISSGDPEIPNRIAEELDCKLSPRTREIDYGLVNGGKLKSDLKDLNLYHRGSHEKFLPQKYIYSATVEQRKELLRGLMDTDGTVTHASTGSFATVSRELADDVVELVRSLGGVTSVKERKTNGGCGYVYRVRVNLPFNPFWIHRKRKKFNTEATQGRVKAIRSIERVEDAEAVCIQVDNPDSLYVTTDYTVTHNSHFGASFVFHFAQKYAHKTTAEEPLMTCVVANTDRQAKDAAGEHFINVGRNILGYRMEYFSRKKLGGQERSKYYAVDLDGNGYNEGRTFVLLVRSLESVKAMEGSEFDLMWIEELQDAQRDNFTKAISRNRGTKIATGDQRNPLFMAGMTDSKLHWMYDVVENGLGLDTEDKFDPETSGGILYEQSLYENLKNVGQGTLDDYESTFDERRAEQHIMAIRTSGSSKRVLHEYRDSLHRTGRMSKISCWYDEYSDLMLSVDFNVFPLCASVWQTKDWNDAWLDPEIEITFGANNSVEKIDVYESEADKLDENIKPKKTLDELAEYAEPDTEILAQVDEYEVWPDDENDRGTRGMMKKFVRDYQDHVGQVIIVGDATGRQRSSATNETNWDIIRKLANNFKNPVVIPGLVSNMDLNKGETKWSNPPKEDTVDVLNALLQNARGEARLCFLPESEFKSGGCAASCSEVERRPDGRIDDRIDRSEDKAATRTHFFDTARYIAWYYNGGRGPDEDEFDAMVNELGTEEVGDPYTNQEGGEDWDPVLHDESSGSEWLF